MRKWLHTFWLNLLSKEKGIESKSPNTGASQTIVWPGQREWKPLGFLLSEKPWPTMVLGSTVVASAIVASTGNGELFGRMGALVVGATIYFSASAIREIRSIYDSKIYAELFAASEKIAEGVVTLRENRSSISATTPAQRLSVASALVREASNKMKPFYSIELVFGLIGTLQWAFGDCIVGGAS